MQKAFFLFPKDNAEKPLHCNLIQISSASDMKTSKLRISKL